MAILVLQINVLFLRKIVLFIYIDDRLGRFCIQVFNAMEAVAKLVASLHVFLTWAIS